MKKNYLIAFTLTMAMGMTGYAQQVRNCGTMPHLHDLEQQDPTLTSKMQHIERETQQWIDQNKNSANKGAAIVTIPVVVHVVYNTSSQNISDAQINSQISILNQDFRKLNSDISLVPSAFSGLTADCEIQFCLAQRDPNGNATNGIVRKSTTVTSFSSNDNIKRSANGGSDAWNTSAYLNLWVGNLSGGLLGYAQFPGGTASTDGVVCLYTAFGNTGVAAAPFNKGRTATHEIGHWLNLRHIWGDASCGNDQVTDTPTQQTSNYGCPSFPHVTCSNGPNGDMFMNYMDYTDDACMFMFTAGQKSRMLASLNTTRASLLTSQGCVPPSGVTCGTPSGLIASGITTTAATLNWTAVSGALSYNVQYRQVGNAIWTSTTSTTTSKSISGLSAATNYEFQVQTVCSTLNSSFSASSAFTTASAACTDAYESNNSRTAAKPISVNTNISAKIGASTDKDWFSFSTVSGTTNIKVVLDQLPFDYDLKLVSSSGSTLATSQLSGTATETIIRNTTSAASYFVQVYGYSGVYSSTSCYRLRVNTSGSSFKNDGLDAVTEGNFNLQKVEGLAGINLFPNPASDVLNLTFFNTNGGQVKAELADMLGRNLSASFINSDEGFNNTSVNIADLKDGIYFLRLSQGDQSEIRKFIVKH